MDVNARKKNLRGEMLQKRAALDRDYIRSAGDSIQRRVLSSEEYRRAKSVFVYVSVDGEPPTDLIIRTALKNGKRVYVPKCISAHTMEAVRLSDPEDLVPGAYGIPEPVEIAEIASPAELDLVIVPCVAASPDGARLGHGAGYYDRFLENAAGRTVCLCFKETLRGDIPTEEHDAVMGKVVTEEGAEAR